MRAALYYEEAGQGLPVVLLHGFPFDHRIWQAQQAALSDAFRIITPDLRGHGQSPAPEGVYNMDTLAEDVIVLLDRLGIERAVWVGHSMGGYVTMAALRTAPDRVWAVALVATHPFADSEEKRAQRLEDAEQTLKNGSADVASSMIGVLFSPHVERQSPTAQYIYNMMIHTSPVGIVGSLRGMANRPDSMGTLRTIKVPAVVIAGQDDQIVQPGTAQQVAAEMPHTKCIVIEGAGHLPMVECPETTTAALRDFLESRAGLKN
jgi:3-oxoadipate enol-lactonase